MRYASSRGQTNPKENDVPYFDRRPEAQPLDSTETLVAPMTPEQLEAIKQRAAELLWVQHPEFGLDKLRESIDLYVKVLDRACREIIQDTGEVK